MFGILQRFGRGKLVGHHKSRGCKEYDKTLMSKLNSLRNFNLITQSIQQQYRLEQFDNSSLKSKKNCTSRRQRQYRNDIEMSFKKILEPDVRLKWIKLIQKLTVELSYFSCIRYSCLIFVLFLTVFFLGNIDSSYSQLEKKNTTDIKAVDIGINQLANKSYFLSPDEDIIYVIDENKNRIIKSLDAPDLSHSGGIDINLERGLIYVSYGFIGDGFYVINGTTDEIIETFEFEWLHDFEINPLNNMLYAINQMPDISKVLDEFDLATKNIVRSIPIDRDSYDIEISPSKELIYIGHGDKGQVSIINTSSSSQSLEPAGNISVAKNPSDMIINPLDNKIFLINDKANRISVIDTNNNNSVKTIILNSSELRPESPSITMDPKNNFIYVSNPKEGKVLVVDENSSKLLTSIDAGVYPTNLVYSPFGTKLYATSLTDPVSLLNVSKDFISTKYLDFRTKDPPGISTKGSPSLIVLNPITDRLYATYRDLKDISVIDSLTDKILETIPLDFVPSNIGLDPQTNTLYVTSNDTLYALNTLNNTLHENSLSIHQETDNIAIDSRNNIVYVHTREEGLNLGYRFENNIFNPIENFTSSKFFYPIPLFFIMDGGFSDIVLTDTYDNITISRGYEPVVDIEYNQIKDLVYVLTDRNLYAVDFIAGTANNITSMDSIFVSDLLINPKNDIIYVSDRLRNLIQVISGTNGTIIDEIPVGKSPMKMVLNPKNEIIYVSNTDSNSISVIDASTDKLSTDKLLVSGIVFNTNPANSGYIQCKTGNIATNQYVRIFDGERCDARSNRGFEFSNWVENLDNNSTRIISSIPKSDYWYTPIEKFIKSIANNLGVETSNDEAATFNVSRNGNFTANFEMVSPPLPPEYWATLTSFVLTTIIGAYFIPSFIGYMRTRSGVRKLNYFHRRIMSIYDDGNLDRDDVDSLDRLKNKITEAYSSGKLTTEQYNSLNSQVSISYEEIFKQRIDSLKKDDMEFNQMIKKIEDDITDAYSKGRLLELHYNLLKHKISELKENNEN